MANPVPLLNNRYQIEHQLGQGGFAKVYKARDTRQHNRVCAIKENHQLDQAAFDQFKREAAILRRLDHPSLPKVYDDFVDPSGLQYIVMEFVEGDNLEDLAKQRGALPETQVLAAMIQISDALVYMHQNNIIHRDIKHSNILITPTGRAVLVDFGIAKVYDPNRPTTPGARAATPGFAPNEQYHGGTDERSDIYALGATLYFCLTARVPPEATLRNDPSRPVVLTPPRQINPQISFEMEQLILKAMALAQHDRYQTMQELRTALDWIRQGGARHTGIVQQLSQPTLYSNGYSPKNYQFFLVTQTNHAIPCQLRGYMMPLILFNTASVTVEGAFDGNNIFQVSKLTDLQTQRVWTPKPALGRWEQLKIELGLLNP